MARSMDHDGGRRRSRSPGAYHRRQDRSRSPESSRRKHRHHNPPSNDRRDHSDRRRDDRYDTDRHRSSRRRRSPSRSRSPPRAVRRSGPLPSQEASFAHNDDPSLPPPEPKQQPNFAPTGLLAKEANTVHTSLPSTSDRNTPHASSRTREVILKYHEPPEGRKPPASQAWRLFHFSRAAGDRDRRKKEEMSVVDTIPLGDKSCWLFGRETGVVDIPLADPTSGKQHAVIQFRHSVSRDEYGDKTERVRPYVIDLESKAGTKLNKERIEEGRYVELRDGDVLRFGAGRDDEFVVMLPRED